MTDLFLVEKSNVIPMRRDPQYVAKCPDCGEKNWFIRVDGIGDQWENILGTECSFCGFQVDWVKCHRDHGGGEDDAA